MAALTESGAKLTEFGGDYKVFAVLLDGTTATNGTLTVEPSNTLGIEALLGGWQLEHGDGQQNRLKPLRSEAVFVHIADALSYLFLNQACLAPDASTQSLPEGSIGWWHELQDTARQLQQQPGNSEFSTGELLKALR